MLVKGKAVIWALGGILFVGAFLLTYVSLTPPGINQPRTEKSSSQTLLDDGAETVMHYMLQNGRIAATKVAPVSPGLVGRGLTEIQSSHPDWRIVSFSPNRIVVSVPCGEINSDGGFLGAEKGRVAVYRGESDGCHTLEEMTEIDVNSLPEAAQAAIGRGIRYSDTSELPQLLDGLRPGM